jgi:NTE family protein
MNSFQRKTVGLALGSGGVRGLAHVGVIKTLLKYKIPIDFIAGSSIGSWVGAHYALYQDIERLEEFTVGKKKEKLLSFLEPNLHGGLVRGDKAQLLLNEWLENKEFKDTQIPLRIIATDVIKGNQHIFKSGNLALACRASMAIPGLFRPIKLKGKVLIDGGISNPIPDDLVKRLGADIVIAVNLDYRGKTTFSKDYPKLIDLSLRAIDLLRQNLAEYSMQETDIKIQPNLSKYVKWRDYFLKNNGEDIVKAGARETEKMIPEILAKLNQ